MFARLFRTLALTSQELAKEVEREAEGHSSDASKFLVLITRVLASVECNDYKEMELVMFHPGADSECCRTYVFDAILHRFKANLLSPQSFIVFLHAAFSEMIVPVFDAVFVAVYDNRFSSDDLVWREVDLLLSVAQAYAVGGRVLSALVFMFGRNGVTDEQACLIVDAIVESELYRLDKFHSLRAVFSVSLSQNILKPDASTSLLTSLCSLFACYATQGEYETVYVNHALENILRSSKFRHETWPLVKALQRCAPPISFREEDKRAIMSNTGEEWRPIQRRVRA